MKTNSTKRMMFINKTKLFVLIAVILLYILMFVPKLILVSDSEIIRRNEKLPSTDRPNPLKFQAKMDESLLILKYSSSEKTEELITADIKKNVIDFQKKITFRDITPFDRYFRFVNNTNNFIFLRSRLTDNREMNFERLHDKNKYGDIEASLGSIDLDSRKKNSRVFYDWDNYNCRILGYISDRPPEFYITDRNGEIAVVNLYLSRFDGVIFLVNKHDYSNDFLGNITDRNLPDLPVNVQFKDNWRLASYYLNEDNLFTLYMVSGLRSLDYNEVKNWNILARRLVRNHFDNQGVRYVYKTFDKKTIDALDRIPYLQNDIKDKKIIYEALKKFLLESYDDIFSLYYLPMNKFSHLNSRLTGKHGLNSKVSNINDYTLKRVFLEELFPDLIAKSSVPIRLIKSHQIYIPQKGKGIRIPHKCWSPDGGKILFVGAMEKDWYANVYTVDIKTKKTEKILDVNDTSKKFNPDLEWTENGMVITCPDAIFVRDVKVWRQAEGGNETKPDMTPVKLDIPSDIKEMRNGRISPDGEKLMFFGIRSSKVRLFIYSLLTGKLQSSELGDDLNMENYQGTWINRGKRSIIKGEYEYQRFRGLEDLRK